MVIPSKNELDFCFCMVYEAVESDPNCSKGSPEIVVTDKQTNNLMSAEPRFVRKLPIPRSP